MFSVSLDCPFLLPLRYSLTFIRFVYPMFPVSLDCPFLLPLRYSLTFIRFVYPMFPVSLDCPFFIAPSVFSNVDIGIYLVRATRSWNILHYCNQIFTEIPEHNTKHTAKYTYSIVILSLL